MKDQNKFIRFTTAFNKKNNNKVLKHFKYMMTQKMKIKELKKII